MNATARSVVLPALREDLEFIEGAGEANGLTNWVIHDPLQHRFFQIDGRTRKFLDLWEAGLTVTEMARRAGSALGIRVADMQVANLVQFIRARNLSREDRSGVWRDIAHRAAMTRKPLVWRVAHSYLFFKLPLVRPQRWLENGMVLVAPLFTRMAFAVVILAGLLGLYLASRQWDVFLAGFAALPSVNGAILVLLSLVVLKAAHELGHAFTAVRFGCRVPSMGVAFMMLVPLLYTDVSDAWRLRSRRQRMAISAAGVFVELAVAMLATFLWAFLPVGIARDTAFVFATTGWIMSLVFNLNPCARFDGYYLLSDLMRIDNLQQRAFAFGRWQVRRLLFAPALAPPEDLPACRARFLAVYAFSCWVYRLVVFTAIAVLVYYFIVKLVGIALLALELWLLVARPVAMEIGQWRATWRLSGSSRRLAVTGGIIFALGLLAAIPWSTRVEIPAVLLAADLVQAYPIRGARIVAVHASPGQSVAAEEPIIELHSIEIDRQIAEQRSRLERIRLRIARAAATQTDLAEAVVLRQKVLSHRTALDGLLRERRELTVRAPFDGRVVELAADLHPGRWVAKAERLALFASQRRAIVQGYVAETDLYRIRTGTAGRFIPDDLSLPAVGVRLLRVARSGARSIDIPELASTNGGAIAVRGVTADTPVPVSAQYMVELEPRDLARPPTRTVRGVVHLQGTAESFLWRAYHRVSRVLIRESGF